MEFCKIRKNGAFGGTLAGSDTLGRDGLSEETNETNLGDLVCHRWFLPKDFWCSRARCWLLGFSENPA